MIKNIRTKKLYEIRKLIREAIKWYKKDDGMPTFYSSEDYRKARQLLPSEMKEYGNVYPYYTKSGKAIREIAEKILKEVEK